LLLAWYSQRTKDVASTLLLLLLLLLTEETAGSCWRCC
jgi:hypothetical protein